jgi:peroxiredoxin
MLAQTSSRAAELEQRFNELEARLPDTATKEALSVLHALLLESRRPGGPYTAAKGSGGIDATLEHVANLYKTAPGMQGAAQNSGLPIGIPAPDFTLRDGAGRLVSLSDFRGQPVVLVFYPLDWSPACSDQLSLYQSELAEFERHNAQVIGISVDSLYSHGAWAAVRGITFPLLADFNPRGQVAKRYQVWREGDGFSERALFIVDGQGTIRYAHVSPELPKVPDIYELFDQLERVAGAEAVPAAAGA